ncbi:hypothetical protein Tco_1338481 [Tanacetum coccineum]
MANLSEEIQCVGSDTRPPMLDRTDFASWQQRIRLYCRGKENGVNILKSIDEGPFQMGIFRETLVEGTEGALGPEQPRVYSDLSHKDKDRYNADIQATNILLQRYGYQEKDNNKDKTGQIRARDRKEREKTSPTVLSDLIRPACNPLNGPGQPKYYYAQQVSKPE